MIILKVLARIASYAFIIWVLYYAYIASTRKSPEAIEAYFLKRWGKPGLFLAKAWKWTIVAASLLFILFLLYANRS